MFENSLLFPSQVSPDKKTENLQHLPWKKWLSIVALASGIASTAWGTWLFVSSQSDIPSQEPLIVLSDSSASTIYVDISGAVERPGIYALLEGDRVASAIENAGGISSLADAEYVTSSLNLSARLKDEQKIYVPFEGEAVNQALPISSQTEISHNIGTTLVSINDASESELDTLPRIGPATAVKIVEGRPYTTIEELLTKKIIGESVYSEIQPLLKL